MWKLLGRKTSSSSCSYFKHFIGPKAHFFVFQFATVAILEFDYCMNYQKVALRFDYRAVQAVFFSNVKIFFNLSEQQLVDCTPTFAGCDGGWVDSALNYIAVQGGIDKHVSYPYTSGNGQVLTFTYCIMHCIYAKLNKQ